MKVDRFARKTFFPKKCQKTPFFGGHDSGVSWLWEELYAKLLGPDQLLGCPWKVWGMTVQTSYWEGLWHQNCGYTSPILFFAGRHRNQWKTELFRKLLRHRKFSTGKFFRASTQGIQTHSGFRISIWKGGYTNFWTVYWSAKVGWVRPIVIR